VLATWTLTIAGVTRPLSAWGVTSARLTFRSLDVDELTLELRGNVTAAAPAEYGQPVDLARDGVHHYQGTVTAVRAFGNARTEGWSVTVSNAWWQLARTLYQQTIAHYSDACQWIGSAKSTKVVLFTDDLTGAGISTGQQAQGVLTYALTLGIPIAPGAWPAFVYMPTETVKELTLADVLRRCLQVTPDAVTWCDYTGGVPILSAQQRDALPEVAIDLAADPRIVAEFAVRRCDELVPAGVRINYLSSVSCPVRVPAGCIDPTTAKLNETGATITSDNPVQLVKLAQDSAGLPDSVGGLIGTVDLAPAADDAGSEPAPMGLAGQYYASLLNAPWQGTITLRERECSGLVRVGKVVNLQGGHSSWANMRALVQEVSESLLTGETVIAFGPPAHLRVGDWAAHVQFTRRQPWIHDGFKTTRHPGAPASPNCHAGKDAKAKDLLDKLKWNGVSAAAAIGGSAIEGALTGAGGSAGVMTKQEVELCDPPGQSRTFYTSSAP
jgi:hypothetical protein